MTSTNKKSRVSTKKSMAIQDPLIPPLDASTSQTETEDDFSLIDQPIEVDMQSETLIGSTEEVVPENMWEAIQQHPKFTSMTMGLTCAFIVSALFYWLGRTLMKTKFEDMFEEKLPRYKNLLYGIGSVQNIDMDRVLTKDDLHADHFITDEESNTITIAAHKVAEPSA